MPHQEQVPKLSRPLALAFILDQALADKGPQFHWKIVDRMLELQEIVPPERFYNAKCEIIEVETQRIEFDSSPLLSQLRGIPEEFAPPGVTVLFKLRLCEC